MSGSMGSGASHAPTTLETVVLEQNRTIHTLATEVVAVRKVTDQLRRENAELADGVDGVEWVQLKEKLANAVARAQTHEHVAAKFYDLQADWHEQLERMTQRWLKAVDQMQSLHLEVAALKEELARRDAELRRLRFDAALVGGAQ